jgi:hypothetical protein
MMIKYAIESEETPPQPKKQPKNEEQTKINSKLMHWYKDLSQISEKDHSDSKNVNSIIYHCSMKYFVASSNRNKQPEKKRDSSNIFTQQIESVYNSVFDPTNYSDKMLQIHPLPKKPYYIGK